MPAKDIETDCDQSQPLLIYKFEISAYMIKELDGKLDMNALKYSYKCLSIINKMVDIPAKFC